MTRIPDETLTMKAAVPANVLITHAGHVLDPDQDLFADPPEEIGPILSVQSSRRIADRPRTCAERLPAAIGIGIATGLAVAVGVKILQSIVPSLTLAVAFVVGAIAAGVAFVVRKRTWEITYVGERGLARFRWPEFADRHAVSAETFPFAEAAELRTTFVHHYVNGGFAGAGYIFTWCDERHRERFTIRGAHYDERGTPTGESGLHFGRAAEQVWSHRLSARLESLVDVSQTADFRVFSDSLARVGRGFVEFRFGNRTEQLVPAEVALVTIDDGALHIETHGRNWYRGGRVARMAYDRISNAAVFLDLLERYGGFIVTR